MGMVGSGGGLHVGARPGAGGRDEGGSAGERAADGDEQDAAMAEDGGVWHYPSSSSCSRFLSSSLQQLMHQGPTSSILRVQASDASVSPEGSGG